MIKNFEITSRFLSSTSMVDCINNIIRELNWCIPGTKFPFTIGQQCRNEMEWEFYQMGINYRQDGNRTVFCTNKVCAMIVVEWGEYGINPIKIELWR